jgi:ribosomal protein S14
MGSDYITLNTGGAIAPGYGGRVSQKRTRASTKGEQVNECYICEEPASFIKEEEGWFMCRQCIHDGKDLA